VFGCRLGNGAQFFEIADGLVPVQETQPSLRPQMFIDVIILEHADGAIDLQNRKRDVLNVHAAVLAQGASQFVL
jgi:hypothetical protein